MVVAAKEEAKIKVRALAKIYFVKGRDSHYHYPLLRRTQACLKQQPFKDRPKARGRREG